MSSLACNWVLRNVDFACADSERAERLLARIVFVVGRVICCHGPQAIQAQKVVAVQMVAMQAPPPPPEYSITQVLQTMESLAPEIHAPMKTLRNVLECILLLMARDDGSAEPPSDGWVGMGNAVDEHLSRVRQFVDIEVIIVLMQHRVSGRLTDVLRQRAVRLFMECCGIDATSNQPTGRCSSHRYLLHVSSCSYRAWLSFLMVDDDSGLWAQSGLWNSMISYQDVLQLRIEALPSPGKITIMIGRGSLDTSTGVKGLLMRCHSRLGDTGCEMFASPVATSGFGTYR